MTTRRYEIQLDEKREQILVYNEIVIYGPLATEELAKKISLDIANAWNEPNAEIRIRNKNYKVVFQIEGVFHPEITKTEIENNKFPWRKFFSVVENNLLNISFVDGIFSNSGQFLLKNIEKENAKTAPHEIGHTWGLLHPLDPDFRGKGQPHIMLARGSFVDPEYRYTPTAELRKEDGKWHMDKGFTVDTDKRKVLPVNINDLKLENLKFNEENGAHLSQLTNRMH